MHHLKKTYVCLDAYSVRYFVIKKETPYFMLLRPYVKRQCVFDVNPILLQEQI
jgi:hypothetical protein